MSKNIKRKDTVIGFTGDLSFSAKLQKQYLTEEPVDKTLLDFLNSADAAVINHESPITAYRDVRNKKTGITKRICHRSDPEVLDYIKSAFKSPILSFANNHMDDMSDIGIIDSVENVIAKDVRFIGIGRNLKEAFRYEIVGDDIKVGILAVEYKAFKRTSSRAFIGPGLESMTDNIKKALKRIRKEADYAVIVYHGGVEFLQMPDPDKRKLLQSYLDMGFDAVVSHHPHIVQGYEYFNGKPVFYSLGNFLFDTEFQRVQEGTDKGLLLKLVFSEDGVSFETAGVSIDRENGRAVSGDVPESFKEIRSEEYNSAWKKEQKRLAQIEENKETFRDGTMGSVYYKESRQADDVLELISLNLKNLYFKEMGLKVKAKKESIEKAKKKYGLGLRESKYYIAHLIGAEKRKPDDIFLKEIEDFCEKTGTDPDNYYRYGLYNMSGEEAVREAALINRSPEEYYIAWHIARETGLPTDVCMDKLQKVCSHSMIDPKFYYKNELYRMSAVNAVMEGKRLKKKDDKKLHMRTSICESTGMTRAQLSRDIKDKDSNILQYYYYGLYDVPMEKIQEAKQDISEIRKNTKQVRNNTYASAEISAETRACIDRIYELTAKYLSKERVRELTDSLPAGAVENAETRTIAVDMHIMQSIWGFYPDEYAMFGFRDKPMEERLSFISTRMKNAFIKAVNPEEACDVLNNKYLTYRRIPELFGREVVLYDGSNMDELLAFTADRDVFVKKSMFDAMGRGVILVRLPDDPETKKAEVIKGAEEEFSEGGAFIAEELIEPHDTIKRLNSTSVNTVRICTYNDNGKVKVHDSFAKVGREGSFVDNGGAGGIFVHIDIKTGIMDSCGIDEECNRYEQHPDNGTVFRGYAFPEWDKAVETAVKAAEEISELSYIGWDLTYTKDCRWIIVEGNARTQFLGQQATTGRGTLAELAELLGGFDKLRSFYTAEQEA